MTDWAKQNIFTTEGRLNRLKYFKYTLLVSLAGGVAQIVLVWLTSKIIGSNDSFLLSLENALIALPICIGNAMVTVRRCHDLNMSGKYVLLCIIPIINLLFGLYLLMAKGTVGWNNYGADPLLLRD